jgi:5-methylcytosine-specific restriction endonuclease McrA
MYKNYEKKLKKDDDNWIKSIKKKRLKKSKSESRQTKTIDCKTYTDFLQSDYWSLVRNKILIRDGHMCIICHSKDNLCVHHSTYKNHKNELNHLSDLDTLCKDCHKIIHGII